MNISQYTEVNAKIGIRSTHRPEFIPGAAPIPYEKLHPPAPDKVSLDRPLLAGIFFQIPFLIHPYADCTLCIGCTPSVKQIVLFAGSFARSFSYSVIHSFCCCLFAFPRTIAGFYKKIDAFRANFSGRSFTFGSRWHFFAQDEVGEKNRSSERIRATCLN